MEQQGREEGFRVPWQPAEEENSSKEESGQSQEEVGMVKQPDE